MKIRPLFLTEEITASLKKIVEHAKTNKFSIDDLLDRVNGHQPPPGDDKNFGINIPHGYRVVYSIEEMSQGQYYKHLSVSVDEKEKLPNMIAVEELMGIIGFENKLENCFIKLGDIGPNHQCIEVIEKAE